MKRKRAVRLGADWQVPDHWITWARRQGMTEAEARRDADMLKDWSLSDPKGVKLDWFAAYRNWVRRSLVRPGKMKASAFDEQIADMRRKTDG
jgi:hypothetical protein